ncbi:MBL fold metallo-hydrolase [Rubrivirga sp.]|uniref:MBL fold metallo-hydrolase n=1 Tax=Rubrivirga sp. TaxID=1885344 RepID=UPI003C706F3D
MLAVLAVAFGVHISPALGAAPDGERLARIEQSPNYRDGRFANALPTLEDGASVGTVWEYLTGGSDDRSPSSPLEVVSRTAADFETPVRDLRVTWLGHSTLLVEIEGARVLVDPVWGEHASPSPLLGVGRFSASISRWGTCPRSTRS